MATKLLEPHFMATREQVEAHFGYPTRRALELYAVHGGGPRITRIGRRCLYRISDVDDWLRSFETVEETPKALGSGV